MKFLAPLEMWSYLKSWVWTEPHKSLLVSDFHDLESEECEAAEKTLDERKDVEKDEKIVEKNEKIVEKNEKTVETVEKNAETDEAPFCEASVVATLENVDTCGSLEKLLDHIVANKDHLEGDPARLVQDTLLELALVQKTLFPTHFFQLYGVELTDVMSGAVRLRPLSPEGGPIHGKTHFAQRVQHYLLVAELINGRPLREVVIVQMFNYIIEHRALFWQLDAFYLKAMEKLDEFEGQGLVLPWHREMLTRPSTYNTQ